MEVCEIRSADQTRRRCLRPCKPLPARAVRYRAVILTILKSRLLEDTGHYSSVGYSGGKVRVEVEISCALACGDTRFASGFRFQTADPTPCLNINPQDAFPIGRHETTVRVQSLLAERDLGHDSNGA